MAPTKKSKLTAGTIASVKKSDATRARILDASARVFSKKGYLENRMADIAKAAKTHAGAMYYYFESKDALVEELMHRNAARSQHIVEQRVAELPPNASYRDKVMAVAHSALSNLLGEKNGDVVVYTRLLGQVPAEIRNRMLRHAVESRHFAKALIREGQDSGEFNPNINPTVAALMLLSNLIWCHDWFKLSSHHTIEDLAHDMCEILLAGVEQHDKPKSRKIPKSAVLGRRTAHSFVARLTVHPPLPK